MYTIPPKKLLIINILNLLRKYTDENHRLSQKEIVNLLQTEYSMKVDRKSVRRNILNLIDCGYDIEYKETTRRFTDPATGRQEESSILSDFYLVREFTDSELRLLIDGLLFSKHLPYSQCRRLIEKLEGLSSKYFKAKVKFICTLPDTPSPNRQLFYTIDVLDEAMEKHRQVAFTYNSFGTDKKLHPKTTADGRVREYIVNPYQIAATNGRYYLICNYDKYDNVGNYRLDRITDIRMLDTPAKPTKAVKGLEHGFDLPKHMAEHIYMFAGESGVVTFRFEKSILNDVMDWFGSEVEFFHETQREATARVHVNLEAMRRWALQYALHTRILSPKSLAEQVKQDIHAAMANYEQEDGGEK